MHYDDDDDDYDDTDDDYNDTDDDYNDDDVMIIYNILNNVTTYIVVG